MAHRFVHAIREYVVSPRLQGLDLKTQLLQHEGAL